VHVHHRSVVLARDGGRASPHCCTMLQRRSLSALQLTSSVRRFTRLRRGKPVRLGASAEREPVLLGASAEKEAGRHGRIGGVLSGVSELA
jgi:hypothetical protein